MDVLDYDLVFTKQAQYKYAWQLSRRKQGTPTALTGELNLLQVAQLVGIDLNKLLNDFHDFKRNNFSDYLGGTGQKRLGAALYNALFNASDNHIKQAKKYFLYEHEVHLRIVSDCADIQTIPWQILANDDFLVNQGWMISLALTDKTRNIAEQPSSPRFLIIAPELDSKDFADTRGAAHADVLQKKLKQWNLVYANQPDAMQLVKTWEAFKKVAHTPWDIIYFYGHAHPDQYHRSEGACLLFEDHETQEPVPISMGALQRELNQHANVKPKLIYLNACHTGRSGLSSAASNLNAAAVIVNRTDALVDEARGQALAFFEHLFIAVEPRTPHHAIRTVYKHSRQNTVRWLTPVLYQHYKVWQLECPKAGALGSVDVNWQYLLDRSAQVTILHTCLTTMFSKKERVNTQTAALIWYGAPQQNVEMFTKRIEAEIDKERSEPKPVYIPLYLNWVKDEAVSDSVRFEHMLQQCFRVEGFENVSNILRQRHKISGSRPVVFHIISDPFSAKDDQFANVKRIFELLSYWDNLLVREKVHKNNRLVRFIFSFSYKVDEALLPGMGRLLASVNKEAFNHSGAPVAEGFKIHCLPPLSAVGVGDIEEFFKDKMGKALSGSDAQVRHQNIKAIMDLDNSSYQSIVSELPYLPGKLMNLPSLEQSDSDAIIAALLNQTDNTQDE